MSTTSIDELTRLGKFKADDCIILARSGIGIAVRAGSPKPDISSGEAVKKALLAAKGVAYSTGPSGVYIAELVQRMGIADALKPKTTVVTGQSAGRWLRGARRKSASSKSANCFPSPVLNSSGLCRRTSRRSRSSAPRFTPTRPRAKGEGTAQVLQDAGGGKGDQEDRAGARLTLSDE